MGVLKSFLEGAVKSQRYLLDDFITETQTYLSGKIVALKQKETELLDSGDVDKLEDFYDYHDTDYYHFSEAFPNILHESMVILLYSNFEHYLNKLCECECYEKKSNIKYTDIAGNGIFRTVKYLQLICGFNLGKSKCWSEIEYFNKIRNALVHSHGIISENKIISAKSYSRKMFELVNQFTDPSGQKCGEIKFNDTALQYFNNLVHNFMKELFDQL
ncbi:hypothetical protein AGMMS50268_28170 [Spirochaetia bacterium]|nr:hypothetical protein AGMMS50268_28170 [Spirochaetia bacterium]